MNLYKDGGYLRKLIFTLSSVNAVLNALVIAIFMEPEIIVLYKPDGTPGIMGSRWWYLVYVALPVLVSALFSIKVIAKEKANAKQNKDQSSDPIEVILYGKLPHNYNTLMMIVWILAIISWIMTGIALNNIENISVILPSIIVIMLSAVTVFITSIYNSAAPNSVCGIKLKWLEHNKKAARRANKTSMYLGVMSGMIGVLLAAWSLVISSNLPNCIAIAELVLASYIVPITMSYFLSKKSKNNTK